MLERANYAAEDYLTHFPPEQRGAILLGALASVYGKEDGGADTAVWLGESEEETTQLQTRIGHHTIQELHRIRLLNAILTTKEGLAKYLTQFYVEGF